MNHQRTTPSRVVTPFRIMRNLVRFLFPSSIRARLFWLLLLVALPCLFLIGQSLWQSRVQWQYRNREKIGLEHLRVFRVLFAQGMAFTSASELGRITGEAAADVAPARADLEASLAKLGALQARPDGRLEGLEASLDVLTNKWNEIRAVDARSAADFLDRKDREFLDQSVAYLGDVGNRSGLILEPSPANYFLYSSLAMRLVPLMHGMDKLRAAGVRRLDPEAKEKAKQEAAEIQFQSKLLVEARQAWMADLQKAEEADPNLVITLDGPSSQAGTAVVELKTLAEQELLETESPAMTPQDWYDKSSTNLAAVLQVFDLTLDRLDASVRAEAKKEAVTALTIGLGTLALSLAALALVFSLVRRITKRLEEGRRALLSIADGQLDREIPPHREDEIGEMLTATETVQRSLTDILRGLRSSVADSRRSGVDMEAKVTESQTALGATLENLAAVDARLQAMHGHLEGLQSQARQFAVGAGHLAATSRDGAEKLRKLEAVMDRQASNVTEMAASVEEMGATVNQIHRVVVRASEAASHMAADADAGRKLMMRSNASMKRVMGSIETVQEFADLITHLASQTNLLAMNAAIEAAHAGDSGRGFAIVAEEIRKLADQSNVQAMKASQNLTEITKSVRDAEESIRSLADRFDDWQKSSERLADTVREVNAASEEHSRGTDEMVQAIGDIERLTTDVKAEYQTLKLDLAANQLGLETIGSGADEASKKTEEITAGSETTRQELRKLVQATYALSETLMQVVQSTEKNLTQLETVERNAHHYVLPEDGAPPALDAPAPSDRPRPS